MSAVHPHSTRGQATPDASQPRAIGTGVVRVKADDKGRTRLMTLHQSGSLKMVFPNTHRRHMDAVLINTAGGITGGDRFDISAQADAGARLTLTTQASEKAYRAQIGEIAQLTTTLTIEKDARLNWLPQEMILFNHCALHRRLMINMTQSARLLMVEPLVFGRTAMGERLTDCIFRDRITVTRDHRPIYLDGMDLSGDAAACLARPATANGAGAMASLLFVAPEASAKLGQIRAMLPNSAGASMIAEDILVMRLLATDSYEMRRSLIPVLDYLSQSALPLSWRL
ncbi:urease accessory protein UreD [Iodidimonas gelatinilytica]|uniref:Urease accessory protein UreD n=1 Tax=Iodidimonas gelatinilytica TaxID=1236966 RepID=A0A5A7MS59_9PROT|nr:urease accessory protein UreD [Iodidimonas gelatinilytica]GEQ97845.1 urease accessory protein UreD [Iodidimonas gelatinilytica]